MSGAQVSRLLLPLLLICGSSLALTACQKPQISSGPWPWMPSGVELHGLSRFIVTEDEEVLSLRIEFLDPDGDPTKFPGELDITVNPEPALDSMKRRFTFDLSDLKVNERHWDRVTSTYRFKLDMTWEEPPLPNTLIRVQVKARSEGGPDFKAGITLRRGG